MKYILLPFWPVAPLTCVPLLVPRPSLTYSQISETSLSCELTLWCGAVGRDPKPLIRHLNSPPTRYNFPRCVPAVRLESVAADLTDWKEGRDSASCCSRVIYLFMEAFYSHIMGQASFPEAQKGSHARLSLSGGWQEERCWSGECLWELFLTVFILSEDVEGLDQRCQNSVLRGRNPAGFSVLPGRTRLSPRQVGKSFPPGRPETPAGLRLSAGTGIQHPWFRQRKLSELLLAPLPWRHFRIFAPNNQEALIF